MTDAPNRRGVLAGLALAGVAGAAKAQSAPWSTGTAPPSFPVPEGATDCHHHIYDPAFRVDPTAALRPPPASVADYRLLQKRLGFTRNVVVQPSTYGVDNSGLVQVLREFGETARGVAVVNPSVSDAELASLNAAGVRGIRFNVINSTAVTLDMVPALAQRIAGLGWHVQVQATGDQIVGARDLWFSLPCPVVFDHLGRLPHPGGPAHPAFAIIVDLMRGGLGWVKLSGLFHETKVGPPSYSDTAALATAYVRAVPHRLVWGSDWPHPTEPADRKPDDSLLLDLLRISAGDEATLRAILVDNPVRLYRFE